MTNSLTKLKELFKALRVWCHKKNEKYGNMSLGRTQRGAEEYLYNYPNPSEKDKWKNSKRNVIVSNLIDDAINAFYLAIHDKQNEWKLTRPDF